MARQKCTFKLQGNCTFKWQEKKCTFKWQDKSLRLNGKEKVYV